MSKHIHSHKTSKHIHPQKISKPVHSHKTSTGIHSHKTSKPVHSHKTSKDIHSQKKGQTHSVLFVPFGGIGTPSSRLICYENANRLKKHGWKATVGKGDPRKFDVTVFQKRFSPSDLAMARRGRKVVLQLSEAYWLKGKKDQILKLAKRANGVVAGSNVIRSWFKKNGQKSVYIPTGLDMARLPKAKKKRSPLTICWIGSLTNERYLSSVVGPLNELWKKYDFELRIIGGKKPGLRFKGKCHFIKWKLGAAERQVSECHIGIAPLRCGGYEAAKPPSKPTLYMAQGLAVVATETPPYKELVKDGVNGFLVRKNNPTKWKQSLETLLSSEETRNRFVKRGQQDCKVYDAKRIAKQWDKFLRGIV